MAGDYKRSWHQGTATQEHGYKTLVVDSMLESMITAYVCEQNGWKAITDLRMEGYGAHDVLLEGLDYLATT